MQEPVFAAAPVVMGSRVEAQEVIAAACGRTNATTCSAQERGLMLDAFDPGKQLAINSPVDAHQISETVKRSLAQAERCQYGS